MRREQPTNKKSSKKITKPSKGWVKNPKNLEDIIKSIESLGYQVNHSPINVHPSKIKL